MAASTPVGTHNLSAVGTPSHVLGLRAREGTDEPEYLIRFVGRSVAASQWLLRSELSDTAVVDAYRRHARLDEAPAPSVLGSSSSSSSSSPPPPPSLSPSAAGSAVGVEGKEEKKPKLGGERGAVDAEAEAEAVAAAEADARAEEALGDAAWRSPAPRAAPAAPAAIDPYRYDPERKEVCAAVLLSGPPAPGAAAGVRLSDTLPAAHVQLLTRDYILYRTSPMCVPASSFFRTTATVRLPRTRTKRSVALAVANARYLLGSLVAVGYARATVSLDLFAHESVCRHMALVAEERRLGAERRYQLMLEMRTITWFIASRTDKTGARLGLDRVPSASLIEGMLADYSKEKKDAARKREHQDCDALVESGKWLSASDRAALSAAVRDYFSKERLEPIVTPTATDAWNFQGYFVLHLLNDDVVPVPRSELLGSLQRGTTCQFDKDTFQWTFRFEAGAGKTKAPTLLRLPVTSNGMMRAWLKYYRPVLLKTHAHEYVFLQKSGSAPRIAYAAQIRALQVKHIGKSAAPHAFRGMQATDAHHAGVEGLEAKALAWGRQHSEATVKQYYAKPSHKRLSALAESALAAVRAKRQKLVLSAGGAYAEVAEDELALALDEE